MQKRYGQSCPIARTLDLVGDRWTLLILRDLALGCTRFNEFLANSAGLPPKILSQRLKYLVENGLVERKLEDDFPPRPIYTLTERGQSLSPVMEAIVEWGFEHLYDGEEDLRGEMVSTVTRALPGLTK